MPGRHEKENFQSEKIIMLCAVLLSLTLLIASAIAWFSMGTVVHEKNVNLSVGKVRYTIQDSNRLFFTLFDFDEGIEDDFDPDDGYFPATSISGIKIGGETINAVNNVYSYDIAENSKTRITIDLLPANATDKISFVSSDPDIVSVSEFGTIRGIGNPDSEENTATITISITDRSPSSFEGHRDTTLTTQIEITVVNGDANEFSFLPGRNNVLKNPVTLTNYSTVDSKLRVRVAFTYSDYAGTVDTSGRRIVDATTLIAGITNPNFSNVTISMISPLKLTLNTGYSFVLPKSNQLSFADESGKRWTADDLYLTSAEEASLITSLSDQNSNPFVFRESMINRAHIYVCYNAGGTGTDTISAEQDYGTAVPNINSTIEPDPPTELGKDCYQPVTEIYTRSNYAGFSDRKIMNISVSYQARQSDFFEESSWFDVYCTNAHDYCSSNWGNSGS